MKEDILIVGMGGQGIKSAGILLGKIAAELGLNAVVSYTYGAEVRGGAVSSSCKISTEPLLFQFVEIPDFLIVLHWKGLSHLYKKVAGIIIADSDLAGDLSEIKTKEIIKYPMTRRAEELGSRLAANLIALGIYTALSRLIKKDIAIKVLEKEFSGKVLEINKKAFELGFDFGKELRNKVLLRE